MLVNAHKTKTAIYSKLNPTMSQWPGYGLAVVGVAVAALVRLVLARFVGELPYLTFYPAVFAAALMGGTGPGVLATILSALAADVLFLGQAGTPSLPTGGRAVGIIFFVAVNIGVSVLGGQRRAKSAKLRKGETLMRLAHQVTHIGTFESNMETGVNTWSPELEAMYGLKPGQFGGTQSAWEALVHPEDRLRAVATVERTLRTFQPEEDEWRVVWPDGTVHWLLGRSQAFPNRAGRPLRIVGVNIDITKRKLGEEAVWQHEELLRKRAAERETDERFRTMVDAIPNQAWIARPDGYIFWFNRRCFEYTGATQKQLEGWAWKDVHDPQVLPEVLKRWRHSIDTGEPFEMEFPVRGADGRFRSFLTRILPLKDDEGRVKRWFGTLTDVTQQKENQEILRLSEERFRTMANTISQLAWIARADGHFIWFNHRVYEYTGATPEQLEGWGWGSVIDPQELPKVAELWRHSLATGEPFVEMEFPIRGANGRFRPFLAHTIPVKDDEGRVTLWFGTGTDISELREREKALARQARLIDLSPTATLVLKPDQTITFWSDGAERLYGWSRKEALGRRSHELLRTEFPERLKSIMAKLQNGGVWSGELRHYTRDNRQVLVQSYWLAERNAQGDITELLESNSDITERKSLQEHLEDVVEARTAKLHEAIADLKHMSYSMVHDMRAPLRAMQGFSVLLEEECPDCQHSPALDFLHHIRESSSRLDRLITDALNYNRVVCEELPMVPIEIGRLLRGMLQTYPNLHRTVADISIDLVDLTIVGNESLLTQCFGNLLDNAVKFVAPHVRPCIHVWAEQIQGRGSEIVRIWIEDNGIGIPKAAQEKIFRMFHRMHSEAEYPGTGIGLTIVKKAVERMNGRVGLESEPGKGSKFWIDLPNAVEAECHTHLQKAG